SRSCIATIKVDETRMTAKRHCPRTGRLSKRLDDLGLSTDCVGDCPNVWTICSPQLFTAVNYCWAGLGRQDIVPLYTISTGSRTVRMAQLCTAVQNLVQHTWWEPDWVSISHKTGTHLVEMAGRWTTQPRPLQIYAFCPWDCALSQCVGSEM